MNIKKGDKIRYGAYGECVVSDRREENIGLKTREFFVLTQTSSSATIFVPVEKQSEFKKIKKALSPEEIRALVSVEAEIDWSSDERQRDEEFKKIIERDEIADVASAYVGILARQKELRARRKKLRNTDANIMKLFEKILYDEFSRTIDLRPEDVACVLTGEKEPVEK